MARTGNRREAESDRRSACAILFQASMTPALFVEFGLKALRHPWIVVARVATWTGSPGGAAGAGVLAFPREVVP